MLGDGDRRVVAALALFSLGAMILSLLFSGGPRFIHLMRVKWVEMGLSSTQELEYGWETARLLWFQPMDADAVGFQDLVAIRGIGPHSAKRFLMFRSALGGFLHRDQWTFGPLPYGNNQAMLLGAYMDLNSRDE